MKRWNLFQGCKFGLTSENQLIFYFIGKINDKSHMVMSIDKEIALGKIQHSFIIKTLKNTL